MADENVTGPESENVEEKVVLKRRIKLYQAPSILLGLIIGSFIYITPGRVLEGVGSPGGAVLLWVLGGVFSTLGAVCYAELGLTFPVSGEKYYYLERIYGAPLAFCYMWFYLFFHRPGANAVKCIVFASYLLKLVFPECEIPDVAIKLVAVLLCVLIAFINCVTVEWSNKGQTVCLFLGSTALAIFSVLGLVYIAQGKSDTWEYPFEGSTTTVADIIFAFYAAVTSYGGWNALNFMIEELQDPVRNLPLAIYITMFVVTTLYVLVNVAYMSVLGVSEMLHSQAVAVSFGQVLFPSVVFLVPIVVCLSQISSFNSGFMVSSRLGFVTARRGHLPQFLALISTWSYSPITSIFLQVLLVQLVTHVMSVSSFIKNKIFLQCFFDALTIGGMIYLRVTKPLLYRPLKYPLVIPVVFLLMLITALVLPLLTKAQETLIGFAIIFGTAVPVYYILVYKQIQPKMLYKCSTMLLRFAQKLLLCLPQGQSSELQGQNQKNNITGSKTAPGTNNANTQPGKTK